MSKFGRTQAFYDTRSMFFIPKRSIRLEIDFRRPLGDMQFAVIIERQLSQRSPSWALRLTIDEEYVFSAESEAGNEGKRMTCSQGSTLVLKVRCLNHRA